MNSTKYIYSFGNGQADGRASERELLGGKGANLAEMVHLGIPVPPGFTISTDVCRFFYNNNNQMPPELEAQVDAGVAQLEKDAGKEFNSQKGMPLLVSVRSGAAVSMPGMMDTVLNLGINDEVAAFIAEQTGNQRFALDSYRRFIQMFSNVVLQLDHHEFEEILESLKKQKGYTQDLDLQIPDLEELIEKYKNHVNEKTGSSFPLNPREQLQKAIEAVIHSWNNPRAITYRKMNDIEHDIGTAVTIQSMVFGNMGETSGTGVAFTRNPSNGEKKFFGEFLMNAQGEDVVAGIRTPESIENLTNSNAEALQQLKDLGEKLEKHYQDMQDMEFTIENKKLYLLQTRNGKRTSFASIRIAVEMEQEGLIDEKTALKRIDPAGLPALLANVFNEDEKNKAKADGYSAARGLAAGPGAAAGRIALSAEKVKEFSDQGVKSILVRLETSPEDINGMYGAEGILTARGGMTSHAAVVARGMNKPCIVGCSAMQVDMQNKSISFVNENDKVELKEGDEIAIDGFTGEVFRTSIATIPSEIEQVFIEKTKKEEDSLPAQQYAKLMAWADKYGRLKIRTNADTEKDSQVARAYGAQGIGLCRTEHMFFEQGRIQAMRKMILSESLEARETALAELLPFQREDFYKIFKVMAGLPVTIRLLDPPLHEFLPNEQQTLEDIAKEMNIEVSEIERRIEALHEQNPMLGHRGCRLGISYPEITRMQARAILEAASQLKKEGLDVLPEIMVPLVGHYKELANQRAIIEEVAQSVAADMSIEVDYMLGTMIEVPRAAITADEIAEYADFFSFGTNDLTQMGSGFSRDDSEHFLPHYLELEIYQKNPFQVLDREGIGKLIQFASEKGRSTKPKLKLGVCGEHGGDPSSIEFCDQILLDYVSCSPYRVPIARVAAAKAALN